MDPKKMNPHFASIVMMFATACWQHLGKVPNQVTGKTEVDLSNAQMTIDMLSMIRDKTKGNLTSDEEKMLSNAISDLQLNYADEVKKQQQKPPEKQEAKAEAKSEEKSEDNK